jgi:hypothetical protein
MTEPLHCFGVLALELTPDGPPGTLCLARTAVDPLGHELGIDLQRLLPGITELDGVFAGASYDPAELLRPGWPIHAALAELAMQLPGARGGRIAVLGAHEGEMPAGLQPDAALAGGPLRLLPFVLAGEPAQVAMVGRAMEERLLDSGMAAAATALRVQSLFGVALEHARFMTLHDLCALTAMQYGHAGLESIWPLIETALLAPEREQWLSAEGEPPAVYARGMVHIGESADADRAGRLRVRQIRAVLAAHGIETRLQPIAPGDDPSQWLLQAPH